MRKWIVEGVLYTWGEVGLAGVMEVVGRAGETGVGGPAAAREAGGQVGAMVVED